MTHRQRKYQVERFIEVDLYYMWFETQRECVVFLGDMGFPTDRVKFYTDQYEGKPENYKWGISIHYLSELDYCNHPVRLIPAKYKSNYFPRL